ncbi:MAG: adhesin [Zoogloeaceae bacterium]|nr:adhesin [Zoogloeaceae bacterium]
MKSIFKITPVALAVTAVFASPVFADSESNGNGRHHGPYKLENRASVDLDTEWDLKNDITVKGGALAIGIIPIGAESAAVVDGKQLNGGNEVFNDHNTNNAKVNGNAMSGASGNIGLNVTAGSNNQQANEAALSAVDAAFVFASAQNFALQSSSHNPTHNMGVANNATLNGNALMGASGNIGVNISAGSSNQQRNELSASVNTSGTMAKASTWGVQETSHNTVWNKPVDRQIENTVRVNMSGELGGGYIGGGRGGYSGTTSGSTSGNSYQMANYYLDSWSAGLPHPNGSSTGHLDMDNAIQNATANPNRQGVGGIGFDNVGTYRGSESGRLGFVEAGLVGLSGSFSGNVTYLQTIYRETTNNATLGGNALQGASGNIGVNIAAGSTNQQRNSMAIAAALGRTGGTPGGE